MDRTVPKLPSGKHTQNYGKSPCSIGKINELNGPFSSSLCQITKGYLKPVTVPPTSMSPAKITLWSQRNIPDSEGLCQFRDGICGNKTSHHGDIRGIWYNKQCNPSNGNRGYACKFEWKVAYHVISVISIHGFYVYIEVNWSKGYESKPSLSPFRLKHPLRDRRRVLDLWDLALRECGN